MTNLKYLISVVILMISGMSFSQDSSAPVPAEMWLCELNEGFTLADVRQVSKDVEAFSEKNGMTGGQWIFTTFMGDMNPNGFALMTAWPDFTEMGGGFQNFFTNGEGDKIFSRWLKIANCPTRSLVMIENPWSNMD